MKQASLALSEPARPVVRRGTKAVASVLSNPGKAPLSSVWEGSDSELLEVMSGFYATIPPEPILDSTYNAGRMRKGSSREVVSMDIDARYQPMIAGDNRKMEGVPDSSFGAVI